MYLYIWHLYYLHRMKRTIAKLASIFDCPLHPILGALRFLMWAPLGMVIPTN